MAAFLLRNANGYNRNSCYFLESCVLNSTHLFYPETPCKCCASRSLPCGVVDFSRGGADNIAGRKVNPYSGVPVFYYRCEHCGFTFARAFDDWTPEEFSEKIYNTDYVRQDPDYVTARPIGNAEMLAKHFPELAAAKILDFGSGSGLLEEQLRERGFNQICSYDPFSKGQRTAVLHGKYDVILAFEVFEHHVDPCALIKQLSGLLDDNGVVLLSTLFVPESVAQKGIETWWYCMPRNGHLSFFTPASLAFAASACDLNAASFNDGFHFLFKTSIPSWATRMEHTVLTNVSH